MTIAISAARLATAPGYQITVSLGSTETISDGTITYQAEGATSEPITVVLLEADGADATQLNYVFIPPSAEWNPYLTYSGRFDLFYNDTNQTYVAVDQPYSFDGVWVCDVTSGYARVHPLPRSAERVWAARGAAFNRLGNPYPLVVADVRQSALLPTEILVDDEAAAEELIGGVFRTGSPVWFMGDSPEHAWYPHPDPVVPEGLYWVGDIRGRRVSPADPHWVLSMDLALVETVP